MSTHEDIRAEALAFLKFQDLGVLSTRNGDGVSSRVTYYAADDHFNVYILTLKNTRKVEQLLDHAKAAFTIYDRHTPATMQIEGILSDRTESATIDPIVVELAARIANNGDHFAPLTHMDPSAISFIKLTPSWVRYGNFSSGTGSDQVFTEIDLHAE